VRRLILALLIVGCASAGTPPGGPPDIAPPKLLQVRPDTNAVNVRARSVELRYDEVVNERVSGATSLSQLFVVSPNDGEPRVSWHRSRLVIAPRKPFRPNVTYTITQLPGMSDLRNNVDSTSHTYVFSTGPAIARTRIAGIVFDWITGKAAPRALIQAIVPTDSTTYVTYADTAGRFIVPHLTPGKYVLRAIIDANRNRALDPREVFDSATITVGDSTFHEMLAFVHDTIGPLITTVTPRDSMTLRVAFDKALAPTLQVNAAMFAVKGRDSTDVPIAAAVLGPAFDKLVADSVRAKQVQDSIAQARSADSARRADSARAPQTPRAAPPPAPRRAAADTTPPPPKPSLPSPATEVVIRLSRPLAASASYRVRATGMRNLMGRERTSERVFTTPKPPPKPDSTRIRRDTAGVRRDTSTRADSVRRRPAPGDSVVRRPDLGLFEPLRRSDRNR
jgi:hypothetical protein